MTEQLHESRCRSADLGKPIPDLPHAVSVCLPLWEHNVGYEESNPAVTERMQCGYPRFFVHPLVRSLFAACEEQFAGEEECCLAFPSESAARRCREFLSRRTGKSARVEQFRETGIHAVVLPQDSLRCGLDYWQHSGEIVSSRQAEAVLDGQTDNVSAGEARFQLKERIAAYAGADSDDVYLFPTGMAAIYLAYRVFRRLWPDRQTVQFGFPYVDTLKIQQKFATAPNAAGDRSSESATTLFPRGDEQELDQLERLLRDQSIAALFCEFPCNPLLNSPDVARLSELAAEHHFPLMIDDTLATTVNADLLPACDMLTTSLTKFFSGRGDVMGGAMILNPNRPLYEKVRPRIDEEYEDHLFESDAIVLEQNSRDYAQRVRRINGNAEALCDFLHAHPLVKHVYYPKYQSTANYRAGMKPEGGFGGLFSIDLHEPERHAPAFFDALRVCKGPNLGTNFTLCCPYTILAHYHELEFAEKCGVSRYLLRISAGLEEPDWLIGRFREALEIASAGRMDDDPIARSR